MPLLKEPSCIVELDLRKGRQHVYGSGIEGWRHRYGAAAVIFDRCDRAFDRTVYLLVPR